MPRILLFTGDGKGKTTAALGMALRALGHAMRVFALHFVKKDATVGEARFLEAHPGATVAYVGAGFVPPGESEAVGAHVAAAKAGLEQARAAFRAGEHDLYILDECLYAVARGLLEEAEVLRLLDDAPAEARIVLTGRGATGRLVARADTVTEMRCVKHGASAGIPAQDGVER